MSVRINLPILMNGKLLFASVLLGGFALVCARAQTTPAEPRPNILILVADDLGYADLGVQGCTDVPTPHIDSIARQGVRFTHGYVSAPVCSPSRAGLLTGRYQTRFGHELNHPLADGAPVGMPTGERTIAHWLSEAGYRTGHIGKWHLGNPRHPAYAPGARGFEESVWFPGQKKLPPFRVWRNGRSDAIEGRYVDEAMADEAAAFIGRHRDQPWLLYVAFLTPHEPLDIPAGLESAFSDIPDPRRRKFAVMMSLLDASVGRILQALRASGQVENTLIVFQSDNGAPPRNGSSNTPLRGGKGGTWEGGIRTPLLLQWESKVPAGQIVAAPVISLDLLPTALSAAGIRPPDDNRLEGVNLLPHLTHQQDWPTDRMLFWRFGEQSAVRFGDWKLTTALDRDSRPVALKTSLHHLGNDPGERQDLREQHPEKARELQRLWDQWNRHNVAPLWDDKPGRPGERPINP